MPVSQARRIAATVCLFLGVIVGDAFASVTPLKIDIDKFPKKEELVYSISFNNLLSIGTATIGISRSGNKITIESQTKSGALVDAFFPVRDKIVTSLFVDKAGIHISSYNKDLSEGNYKRELKSRWSKGLINFELFEILGNFKKGEKNKKVKMRTNRGVLNAAKDTMDPFTAFFMTRALPFEKGKEFSFQVFDDKKIVSARVLVRGEEQVKTSLGTFKTWVVEPVFQTTGPFKRTGRLLIYMTQDKYRYPVLVRSKIPYAGHVIVELVKAKRGD